jgi:hypothetical protein
MSKLEEIAFANMTREVSPAMRRMIAAEEAGLVADVRADAGRGSVHARPAILSNPDAARVHDAEAREAEARLARRGSGPTVITPLDRRNAAPRGF